MSRCMGLPFCATAAARPKTQCTMLQLAVLDTGTKIDVNQLPMGCRPNALAADRTRPGTGPGDDLSERYLHDHLFLSSSPPPPGLRVSLGSDRMLLQASGSGHTRVSTIRNTSPSRLRPVAITRSRITRS